MKALGIYKIYKDKPVLVQVVLETNKPEGVSFMEYARRTARGWGVKEDSGIREVEINLSSKTLAEDVKNLVKGVIWNNC